MAIIRQAGEGDLEGVFMLINSNLDDFFPPSVIMFFQEQWPQGQLVATDVFGNILGAICGSRLEGGRASVSLFAVDEGCRGKGIGGQLLEAFRRRCFMDGFGVIQLEVRTSNVSAKDFYERRGFRVTELLPGFYNDGGDGYRMVLFVTGCRSGRALPREKRRRAFRRHENMLSSTCSVW
ncbi:MAG: GNAT family N-acetyltransferase [Candidatus Methanomethylophilaceae archaeon]|nr:GNAT family N-acetyltransferase [Candidatus Methanomethylophilaceae archaeon]